MDALNAYFQSRRGAKSDLAKELGLTRAAVTLWRHVPIKHLREVERITGIQRAKLRPDIFKDAA